MKLFLANLNKSTTEPQVEKFFDGYGQVTSMALKGSYGFVTIEDDRDAEDAMKDLQGRALNGMNVHIELARDRNPSRGAAHPKTDNRLLIKNLSTTCDWKDLKALMSDCGTVSYVNAHDRGRNVGFVCFESHADVLRAIEKYQGAEINGRCMQLIDKSSDQAIGNQHSISPSRSPSVIEVSSSPSRSQGGARGHSRAPIRYPSPLRRVSSSASPAMRRVKRHRQPSLSPSGSSMHTKRRREEESEVVASMRAMTDAVQMLIDRMESVENSVREMIRVQAKSNKAQVNLVEGVNELKRKQIEMQRDLLDSLKRSCAPEMLDRREAALPWEANRASFLPTMSSSELPMPVERERKTNRAVPTRGPNDGGSVQETGAIKERGRVTKRTVRQEMPRILPYAGQLRQERDERSRVDYRGGEESHRPELPPVGRGGGIVGKSKGRPVSPRASEPATQLQPAGWGRNPHADDQHPFGKRSINGEEGAARAKPGIEIEKLQQTSGQRNAEEMPGPVASRSM